MAELVLDRFLNPITGKRRKKKEREGERKRNRKREKKKQKERERKINYQVQESNPEYDFLPSLLFLIFFFLIKSMEENSREKTSAPSRRVVWFPSGQGH